MAQDIRVRDLRFGVSQDPRRRWLMGDLGATSIQDCFSMALPQGERFFIRSIKHYERRVTRPETLAAIKDFSAQEAFHSREHDDYNRALRALGHDVDRAERRVRKQFDGIRSPVARLATTCAIEHLTTSFAEFLLENADMLADAPAPYRRLWLWHAVEEVEHAAVALDVYDAVTPHWSRRRRYAIRVGAFIGVLAFVIPLVLAAADRYCRHEGETSWFKRKAIIARALIRRPGFATANVRRCLRYFRPGFRPGTDARMQAFLRRHRQEVDAFLEAA